MSTSRSETRLVRIDGRYTISTGATTASQPKHRSSAPPMEAAENEGHVDEFEHSLETEKVLEEADDQSEPDWIAPKVADDQSEPDWGCGWSDEATEEPSSRVGDASEQDWVAPKMTDDQSEPDWDWGWSNEATEGPSSSIGDVDVLSRTFTEDSHNLVLNTHGQTDVEEEDEWAREDNVERIIAILGVHSAKLDSDPVPELLAPAPAPAATTKDCIAEVPTKRYHGVIKYWRGAFGWITCEEVAAIHPDADIFLHKRDCDQAPKRLDGCGNPQAVSFHLTLDEKGNPKAVDAKVESVGKPSSPVAKVTSICAPTSFAHEIRAKSLLVSACMLMLESRNRDTWKNHARSFRWNA